MLTIYVLGTVLVWNWMKTATQGHKRLHIEFKKLSKRKTWTEAEQAAHMGRTTCGVGRSRERCALTAQTPSPPSAAWGPTAEPAHHCLPSRPCAQQSPRSIHGINGRQAASECDDLGGHMQRYPEHGNRPPRHSLGSGGSVGAAMLARPLAWH